MMANVARGDVVATVWAAALIHRQRFAPRSGPGVRPCTDGARINGNRLLKRINRNVIHSGREISSKSRAV